MRTEFYFQIKAWGITIIWWKFFLTYIFLLNSIISYSQFNDNIWLLGYFGGTQSPEDDNFGISILDFSSNDLIITDNQEIEMNFGDTNTSICDSSGNLLFYFNGVYIEDSLHNIMLNGDTLNKGDVLGSGLPQGGLIIPYPDHPFQYILFHGERGYIDKPGWFLECVGLYYSIVDMDQNEGRGKVIERKTPLIIDTLEYGKITATKHANGRDWWLVLNKSHSNKYYKLLLTNTGIEQIGLQEVGEQTYEGLGQSIFSPDGKTYVKFNATDAVTGIIADVYDFDRCSGDLSNHRHLRFNDYSYSGGVAISPNSRILYIISAKYIYQFDLWSADLENSKTIVATYDGFVDPFPTQFYLAQLARDGKIYMACNNGTKYLHVIQNPNAFGLSCNVLQHKIKLPTYNASTLPNYVNYRLGPIDGSLCDSLGINNIPKADFRFEIDSLNPLLVHFYNLSSYNPDSILWDLGDQFSTSDYSPSYEFPSGGEYNVCLSVENEFGSDIKCTLVKILTSSTPIPVKLKGIEIYPNPVKNILSLKLRQPLSKNGELRIVDLYGKLIREFIICSGCTEMNILVQEIPNMMYYYILLEENKVLYTGKILILH